MNFKLNKEVKIGIISILTIILFYWLFMFLQGSNFLTTGDVYYVKYNDVDGLLPTKPVNVNGLKIGNIEEIKIIEDTDSLYFVVKMVLDRKIQFSKNTVAEIYEPGLMAGKMIKLNLDYKGPPAKSGDTLRAAINQSLMSALSNKLKPTQNRLDSVLVTLNSALNNYGNLADEGTNKSLKEVLTSLNHSIISLEQTSKDISQMSLNANQLALNLNKEVGVVSANTNKTLTSATQALNKYGEIADRFNNDKIDRTLNNLQQSSARIDRFINTVENSDGSLNRLIKDKQLYVNLEETSKNLNILVKDFKTNPDKYVQISVFGKKAKPIKTVEEVQE